MDRNKKNRKRSGSAKRGKSLILLAALAVVLLVGAVGITAAYLHAETEEVKNEFAAASAPAPEISEEFDKTVKKNVKVTLPNEGTGTYYVRAQILVNFAYGDGDIAAKIPVSGTDYTMRLGNKWTKAGEYYYYNGTLTPGSSTENLIDSCATQTDAGSLIVDVLAQTVQADPEDAVKSSWGMQYSGGSWTAVSKG